ncbi:MAG TPA: TIGR00266 family protein [Myxococcota bacterium]|nr:TIGR00266 family protein [Myxococcota bacterium]
MEAAALAFEIVHRPDSALLCVRLADGQAVFAEPAAMVSMDAHVALKAGFRGGVMRSLGRALAGESLVMNTFTARGRAGEVIFAPGPLGDIVHHRLRGGALLLQRGAFVAHGAGVEIGSRWEGMRGFFSGEGLVLLRATGDGDLFFNTYGGLVEVDVRGRYLVDTGYVVAFEDTLAYDISTLPGLGVGSRVKTFLFGGEGLVCRFSGVGKLWVQTRAVPPFLRFVHPFRPVRKKSND